MHTEELTLTSDGLSIAARMVWPDRAGPAPALILCHGFGSCKENHAAFAAQAAAQGWAVLSFDFRGHGASDGCLDSRTIHDLAAALAWLQEQPGIDHGRIAVRGSSMGAYFAIHAARRWPALGCCVALSPPDEGALTTLLRDAHDPATAVGQWRCQGKGFPRVMGCDLSCWLEANDVYTAAAGLAPAPLLLVHAAGDTAVPAQISEDLYGHAREPKSLWVLPAGDHHSLSGDPEVTARTLDWLAQKG